MMLNTLLFLWMNMLLAASSQPAAAPWQAVTHQLVGTVASQSGEPLAGATVALANNRNSSVITNSVGRFLLPSPVPTPHLRVSFAGYYDTTVVMPADGHPLVVELRAINRYKKQLKKQLKSANKAWNKP